MKAYSQLTKEELQTLKIELEQQYDKIKEQGLHLALRDSHAVCNLPDTFGKPVAQHENFSLFRL